MTLDAQFLVTTPLPPATVYAAAARVVATAYGHAGIEWTPSTQCRPFWELCGMAKPINRGDEELWMGLPPLRVMFHPDGPLDTDAWGGGGPFALRISVVANCGGDLIGHLGAVATEIAQWLADRGARARVLCEVDPITVDFEDMATWLARVATVAA